MSGSKQTPGVIAPPPIIVIGVVAFGYGLGRLWPFELTGLDPTVRVCVGGGLFIMATVLAVSALAVMRSAGTPPEPWKPTIHIVSSGPFKYTRNPIYVAMLLVFTGIGMFMGSAWLLLCIPVLFLLLHFGVVVREEAYLTGRFGEEYLAYMRRVRRWF